MELQPCGNCGARLSGEFCQRCGQRRANQIGISRILQDGFAHVFDLESGFLCTLRGLSMRPGAFIRDYTGGQTAILHQSFEILLCRHHDLCAGHQSAGYQFDLGDALKFNPQERRIFHIIHSFLAYMIFLILFPVAAMQRCLFRESRISFSETYVFGLFAFGHGTWIGVLMAVGGMLESTSGLIILMITQLLYLIWAMRGFYAPGGRPPVFRAVLVSATNTFCTNVLALFIGNVIFWLGLVEPLARSIA